MKILRVEKAKSRSVPNFCWWCDDHFRGGDKITFVTGFTPAYAGETERKICAACLKKKGPHTKPCRCREPKTHKDCAYCGFGGPCTHICGVCKEDGIDGPVIRGTERVTCKQHKRKV